MKRFKVRKYAVGAITFVVALGIGLIVQYSDAVASRINSGKTVTAAAQTAGVIDFGLKPASARTANPQGFNLPNAPTVARETQSIDGIPSEMTAPRIILPTGLEPFQQSELDQPLSDIVLTSMSSVDVDVSEAPEVIQPAITSTAANDSCLIEADARAVEMAMVQFSVTADCRAEMRFSIYHKGMSFDFVTDEMGMATATLPALSENALIMASFDDGKSAMAEVFVPDYSKYERAVLIWTGIEGVQLHAREFGASYGGDGHVWRGGNGRSGGSVSNVSGMLTELGLATQRAEVYTFPMSHGAASGNIALSVEVEVTEGNCGTEISAQTMQFEQNQDSGQADLAMTLPDCDAVGEFIVLKNMFEDLTLAQR